MDDTRMSGALSDEPVNLPRGSQNSDDHVVSSESVPVGVPAIQAGHNVRTARRRQSIFVLPDPRQETGNLGTAPDLFRPLRSGKKGKRSKPRHGSGSGVYGLSSLEVLQNAISRNPATDPEAQIPLPESATSSISPLDEKTQDEAHDKSSLDIIIKHAPPFLSPILPSSIPLPESRAGSSEHPRGLLQGLLQPVSEEQQQQQHSQPPQLPWPQQNSEAQQQRQIPPLAFQPTLPILPSYENIIRYASKILPHLGSGNIQANSRHDSSTICRIDYYETSRTPPLFLRSGDEDRRQVISLRYIPIGVKQRVIMVEDLSSRTIDTLGRYFGMTPEFFEEHLINSGYKNGEYNDPSSHTWATSGMKKPYTAMKWHRPVNRLPTVPFSKQDLKDLLDPALGRVEYTSEHSNDLSIFQTETNIFRSEWDLWTNPKTSTRMKRACGWEEKASIWTQRLPDRDCQIVIIVLDPLPSIGQGIERDVFEARRVVESSSIYGSEASVSEAGRQEADEELLERLAEHVKERYVNQQRVSRLHKIRDFLISMGKPPRQEGDSDSHSDISRAFQIVETTNFNKINSKVIFEQISPRGNLDVDFEDAFQNPRLLEELRLHLQTTRPTKDDLYEGLMSAPAVFTSDIYNSENYFGILEPLFRIAHQDAVSLIKLLHRALNEINAEILDEAKMEEHLSIWRELITRAQLELPELKRSIFQFFSYFKVLKAGQERPDVVNEDNTIPKWYQELCQQIDETLQRLQTASSSLTSNMALLDSRRSIAEAQAVTKLTELAFFFIPLTFAASLFGMQIEQLENRAPLSTFVALGIAFITMSYLVRLIIRSSWLRGLQQAYFASIKVYADNKQRPVQQGHVPATLFLGWLGYETGNAIRAGIIGSRTFVTEYIPAKLAPSWNYAKFIVNTLLMVSVVATAPLAVLWTRDLKHGVQSIVTIVILVAVIAIVVIPYWRYTDPDVRYALPRLIKKKLETVSFGGSKVFVVICLLAVLAIPIVPLAVLWTRPLSQGIKVAVTVVLVLVVILSLIFWGIYNLVTVARMGLGDVQSSSYGSGRGSTTSWD